MGRLKGLSELKASAKPPVKAGGQYQDDTGGIFTRKVIAIWQKIRNKWGNS